VPYSLFRPKSSSGDSSEEDPDYKDSSTTMARMEHFEYSFPTTTQTTVGDIKKEVAKRASKIGDEVSCDNLELCVCKYGEVYESFDD
jgi:hypothetical protein